MSSRMNLKLVTACALAIAVSFPAFAGAARDRAVTTTEFSAQNKDDKDKKGGAAKTVAPRQAPARVAPVRTAPKQFTPRNVERRVTPPVRVAPRQFTPRNVERRVIPPGGGGARTLSIQKKTFTPKQVAPGTGTPRIGASTTARRSFTPRGNNARVVTAARIRSAPARGAFRTSIRGRNYSVWRSGYRARYGNRWRTFVALGTLGVLAIGAYEYYPYAYIDAPGDYCDGLTEDGCQLVYDEVPTVDGDAIGQCVAYCPWQ